jgi:hypothetical protein
VVKRNALKFAPVLVILITSAVLWAPLLTQIPGGMVPDDGYFYATIARHIAGDHFSSFDGLHATDGYHQLWQYILAAIAVPVLAVSPDRYFLLLVFLLVDAVLLAATAWLVGRTPTSMAFVFCGLAGCEFLMEVHLLAFLLGAGVVALLADRRGLGLFALAFPFPHECQTCRG